MPGGQGGGWAWPTAGEATSISGRIANTTADTALRCSQGFIGRLLSIALCVEILRFVHCSRARFSTDGGDHVISVSGPSRRIRVSPICCYLRSGLGTPGCHGSGRPGLAGPGGHTRIALGSAEAEHDDADSVVVSASSANEWSDQHSRHSRFLCGGVRTDPAMANMPRAVVSGLIVWPHTVLGSPTTWISGSSRIR